MKQGWPLKQVGELFDVQLGKMLSPKAREGEQLPYLANFNVQWGKFNLENVKSMHFTESEKEKYSLKQGDIIMCEGGEVGRCAIWKERSINFYYQKALHRLRPKDKNTINPYFTCIYMEHVTSNNGVAKIVGETSIAHLTREKLCALKIPCPSKEQQDKIVKIISTWDAAIEKTERLIAAKEKQFKWLLKRLISDQQNNPKWHKVKLGQVIEDIGDGGTPSRKNSDYFGGGIPWVVIDDITFKIDKTKETLSKLGLSKSSAKIWPKDSVIVSTGATIGHVGIATVPMATKQGITGITPQKSIISEYLAYFFLAQTHLLVKYAQGSSFKEIRPETIKKLAFFHPGINRQENIVCTLNTAQKETAFLRLLAEQYRTQKCGLVQKLLTGEWRLKR